MKKFKLIIIFLFAFMCFFEYVNAGTVGTFNICKNSALNGGDGRCQDVTFTSGKTLTEKDFYEDVNEKCDGISYNIAIVLDTSGSMELLDSGFSTSRLDRTNQALNTIFTELKGLKESTGADYNVSVFGLYGDPKGGRWYNISEINDSVFNTLKLNNNFTPTFLQGGLINAYRALTSNNPNDSYSPMLVLISDGVPTAVGYGYSLSSRSYIDDYENGKGVTNFVSEGSTTKIDQTFRHASTRLVYYTVKTLSDISSSLRSMDSNTKILSFKIGGDSKTIRLVMNPNSETLANAPSLYKNAINGGSEYETYAYIYQGSMNIIPGDVSEDGKNVKFTFNWSSSDLTGDSLNFVFPENFDITSIESIEYCDNGGNCNSFSSSKMTEPDSDSSLLKIYAGFNDVCSTSNSFCNNYSFIFKLNTSLNSTSFPQIYLGNNIVDIYTASSDIATVLKEELLSTICSSSATSSSYKVTGNEYEGACATGNVFNYTYNGQPLYYKTKRVFYESSGNIISVGSCKKLSSNKLEYVITESLFFDPGSIKNKPTIYAGGGFNWTGSYVQSTINTLPSYLDSEGKPMFSSITLDGVYTNPPSNGGVMPEEVKISYVDLDDIYIDASCSNTLSSESYDDSINSAIENDSVSKINSETTSNIKDSLSTIDSNKSNVVYNSNPFSVSTSGEYIYNIGIKKACISKDGRTVRYIDSSVDSCDADSEVDGGNLIYTPLKIPEGTYNIKAKGNYSSVKGITLNVNVVCPFDVKQILYDDPNSGLVAYRYRSINHKNPFPKNVIAINWKSFMDNGGQTRLDTTYNKLDYSYSFGKSNISSIDTGDYASWGNISSGGSSSFIDNSWIENATAGTHYCGLGKFSESCNG